ncbi:heme A synthase [Radiobacillus kanasensis]|uniref:COX15/CtaA family protein n=1 Tax=Radiobacillus kanasensis TaxID=2844358 RepID=UPI001E5DC90A|nr:heme A synthase [Radiobacillus kanasensis]UFU00901.1 heme A synthase [Radiobacillus kanasensis]
MIKFLRKLSVIATIIMVLVLVGGALVTKTDSGMGCGANWPICEGEITPQLVIELSHRLVSGLAGGIVLLLSILSWKYYGSIREVKFLAFTSTFFLVVQALIGAAAVLWPQSDFVMATHFGISLISFAAVLLLTLLIFEIDHKLDAQSLVIDKRFRKHLYWFTAYILFVVYTGALVRHADSSMACTSWPFCVNSKPLVFNYHFGQWIQMGHRLIAGIAFIWTIILYLQVRKHYRHNRVMYWGWTIGVALMVLQVILGAFIIFTFVNLGIALTHALVISIFCGLLSYYLLLASRSAAQEKEQADRELNIK